MKNWLLFGCLIGGLALVTACMNDGQQTVLGNGNLPENIDSVDYELVMGIDTPVYSIQEHVKLGDGSTDYSKQDVTKVRITYPRIDSFSKEAVKIAINQIVQTTLLKNVADEVAYESIEQRLDEFIQDYEEHKTDMKEFGLPVSSSWFFELTVEVLLNSADVMALRIHQLEFTGGAHANPSTSYLNIDLQSGRVLKLSDILQGNYEEELLTIAELQFKKSANLDVDTNLMETHYEFNEGHFVLPDNFCIGRKGIHFYYNPYDLGPFALGSIAFEIPYQQLKKLINPDALKIQPIPTKN